MHRLPYFVFSRLGYRTVALSGIRHFSTTALLWGKVISFKLADIGEGIKEVQVIKVFVNEGDRVEEMDNICEVQSDKATVHITSRYSGVIQKVYIADDEVANVGQRLVDIALDEEAEDADASNASPNSKTDSPPEQGVEKAILASPAARSFAKKHDIDLSLVTVTGKGGYITKEDLQNYLNRHGVDSSEFVRPSDVVEDKPLKDESFTGTTSAGRDCGVNVTVDDTVIPIVGVRRGMVKTMNKAVSIAQFTFSEEFELSELMRLRALLKEDVERRTKGVVKLSYLPFFIKSASMALLRFPEVNAYCAPDCSVLVCKKVHNIGFAMDTPSGLIVTTVRDAQAKSVFEIADDVQKLIDKGSQNQLEVGDISDGTFTISNIGSIGGIQGSPILVPPQVAIVALGRIQPLPRFDKDENIVKRNIMTISFTADHRVIDGATMVRFSNAWKEYLENPQRMLLDLR